MPIFASIWRKGVEIAKLNIESINLNPDRVDINTELNANNSLLGVLENGRAPGLSGMSRF